MNYKELFQRVVSLISTPGKAWDEIIERKEGRTVVSKFVYPLIGLCGLSEFLGTLIGHDTSALVFQLAMTRCCAVAVSLFGGFFLASYLLDKINSRWTKALISLEQMQVFVGFSMVVMFVLDIISGLFSIKVLHLILQIYTIVVVFEGTRRWLHINEEKQTSFAIVSTIAILACPALIEFLFNEFSVLFN